MTGVDVFQWIGCALSILGSFLVCHNLPRPRFYGMMAYFLANNAMVTWAYQTGNWGILVTQVWFFIMSIYSLKTHWKDR